MSRFSALGNDLYTGRRSFDIVGRRTVWYLTAAVLIGLSLVGLLGRGLNFGIEFRGGTEFRVTTVSELADYEQRADQVLRAGGAEDTVTVTRLGDDGMRIQTGEMPSAQVEELRADLAEEFEVPVGEVTSSLVGPSWGETVTTRALLALGVFLALVTVVLTVYFRTWKMAAAALVALLHDVAFTVGVYALLGIEVSPASVIGFLTILGYSIYDTIVVFDKVRENTEHELEARRMTYAEAANHAVNQTLVRSVNTSVVALLPVAAILVMGITVIGPGTLLDLAAALFIGIAVGTFSSVFLATPLLVHLREREPEVVKHDKAVATRRARSGETGPPDVGAPRESAPVAAGASGGATGQEAGASGTAPSERATPADTGAPGRQLHPYAQRGPRNQPKRKRGPRRG